MSGIPTQAELSSSLGRTFLLFPVASEDVLQAQDLGVTPRNAVEARLAAVQDGIAMDPGYLCYSASFDLPAGIHLPQELYRVSSPDGAVWELLVTPTRPHANGVATMCAVFHIKCPAENAAGL